MARGENVCTSRETYHVARDTHKNNITRVKKKKKGEDESERQIQCHKRRVPTANNTTEHTCSDSIL